MQNNNIKKNRQQLPDCRRIEQQQRVTSKPATSKARTSPKIGQQLASNNSKEHQSRVIQ
jgi:hypothetical protein